MEKSASSVDTRRWAASLWMVVVATLLGGHGVRAGILSVNLGAAQSGSFGLEATLGPLCSTDDVVVPAGTVNTDQLACNTITAGNVQVVSPEATFTAGIQIILEDAFSVASGVPFTAVINPFVSSEFGYLRDDSPAAETSYNALFLLNPDMMTLATGDEIGHFIGYSADGEQQFRVTLRWNNVLMENRLAISAREDGGLLRDHGADFLLAGGSTGIQIQWSRATAAGNDGEFLISVGGVPLTGLSDLDNDLSVIDYVQWGLVDGTVTTSTGSLKLDEFASWR